MGFLTIGEKLQVDANGKLITIPDGYEGKLIKLNKKLLKHENKLVKGKNPSSPSNTVTFEIKVENCPDFMSDTEDIITANIGDKLENVVEQSTILQAMVVGEAGAYEYITDIEGYDTTIFTVNGDSNADAAYFAALRPDDTITATWNNQVYYVVEAH